MASIVSSPSSYHGYAVQTALLLSQERKVVCEWQHCHLELVERPQEGGKSEYSYTLTIAVVGQAQPIEKTFGWIENVKGFLRDYGFPTSGWLPAEFAKKPAEIDVN